MNGDCLKLTTYSGERDRVGGRFVSDALLDVYERHRVATSVLIRGVEGFGIRHHIQTARLLTLSEDLPVVTVAVDARSTIRRLLPEVVSASTHGLITLERARLLSGDIAPAEPPPRVGRATKLTIYTGRQERAGGRPAHVAVVDLLRRRGIAGATAVLGVDGTAHGERRRAQFFARNPEVPVMVISVGDAHAIAATLPELAAMLDRPLMTAERVRVCKRDGRRLADPHHLPDTDASGLEMWQKLTVYSGEQARHEGRPLYTSLVRRLRREGAAGATVLRGFWGYDGAKPPHGDTLWRLRRHVPTLTLVVDRPERIRRWFAVIDELTDETGLVTSEIVPALRATAPGIEAGGLTLARPQ